MMLAGMLAGALWGLIPGVLKARLGVNEIITTLMLNYIALAWIQFWVFGPWSEGGFQQTAPFPREAWLPRLTDFAEQFPIARRADDPPGDGVRAVAAAIVSVVVSRTRWGYEMRLIGDNPRAARYAGHRHREVHHRRLRRSPARSPVWRGMSEVGRCRPSAPGPHLARLRLHRDHHRVPRAASDRGGSSSHRSCSVH